VRDQVPPVLECPDDITVGACQNVVFFSPVASDGCGGPVTVTSTPASGSTFAIGTTTVNVVARDACGNESRCAFQVTVLPDPSGSITGAAIACPGGSATLTGPDGYRYTWSTGASSRSIVVSETGTYTLTLTDRITGCTKTLSHRFTIVSPPVATISGPDRFCDGASAKFCGPSGPYRYRWTGENGFTSTSRCIETWVAGTFQLVVTDTITGCVSDVGIKSTVATFCYKNCPHTIGWWMAQCDGSSDGAVKYTADQLRRIYSCVNDKVRIFDWADPVSGFCAIIDPDGSNDQRLQAKRQFAGFVANICTSELGIRAENGERIIIDLETVISYPGVNAHTIGELLFEADDRLVALESRSLDDTQVKNEYTKLTHALDAVNNGNIPDSYCPAFQTVAVIPGTPTGPGLNPADPTYAMAGDPASGSALRFYAPAPNPFTGRTRFAYAVGIAGADVDLAVFDLAGRRIRQLARGERPSGRHEVEWDGRDESGQLVQGGLYFIRARVGGEVRRMTVVHVR